MLQSIIKDYSYQPTVWAYLSQLVAPVVSLLTSPLWYPSSPRPVSHLSDVLADVLDHHLVSGDGLQGEQAPVVDARLTEANLLLAELEEEGGNEKRRDGRRERRERQK